MPKAIMSAESGLLTENEKTYKNSQKFPMNLYGQCENLCGTLKFSKNNLKFDIHTNIIICNNIQNRE